MRIWKGHEIINTSMQFSLCVCSWSSYSELNHFRHRITYNSHWEFVLQLVASCTNLERFDKHHFVFCWAKDNPMCLAIISIMPVVRYNNKTDTAINIHNTEMKSYAWYGAWAECQHSRVSVACGRSCAHQCTKQKHLIIQLLI